MRLLITEKHLDLGIEAVKTGSQTQNCVLAQAAKEVIPDFVSCTHSYIQTRSNAPTSRLTPVTQHEKDEVRELVNYFDILKYERVRRMLPIEIEFIETVYC